MKLIISIFLVMQMAYSHTEFVDEAMDYTTNRIFLVKAEGHFATANSRNKLIERIRFADPKSNTIKDLLESLLSLKQMAPLKDLVIDEVLKKKGFDFDTSKNLFLLIETSETLMKDAHHYLHKIIESFLFKNTPDLASHILYLAAQFIANSNVPIQDVNELLKKIIDSKEMTQKVLVQAATAIRKYKWQIKNTSELLKAILMRSEHKYPRVFESVAAAIRDSKQNIEDSASILELITETPLLRLSTARDAAIAHVAFALTDKKFTAPEVNLLLSNVVFHESAGINSNAAAAYAIANASVELEDAGLMLSKIVSSGKIDENGLAWVVRAVFDAKKIIQSGSEILKLVLNSHAATGPLYSYIFKAIKSSSTNIENIDKVLDELRRLGYK